MKVPGNGARSKKNMTTDLNILGKKAREAAAQLVRLDTEDKNRGLIAAADALVESMDRVLQANAKDMEEADIKGMAQGMKDRLRLNEKRVLEMADGLKSLASLPDPVGEVLSDTTLENGLRIVKKRVAIGVIGIIYEARPNVTSDAFGIAFKSGNAVILRGGSDAIASNTAVTEALRRGLKNAGLPENAVQLVEDTSRESARALMHLNAYVDCLIPRGSAGLIQTVVRESTVPVIETGAGNCHIFVDESADIDMAVRIIVNAKTQRIGVCNAAESLVVHRNVENAKTQRIGVCNAAESLVVHRNAEAKLLPALKAALDPFSVEIRADESARSLEPSFKEAAEEDWGMEYLDYILSLKTVDSVEEAISHINRYHTQHSDAIVTESKENAERFLKEVDSACVYWNASTRFTDGGQFGFGAEIGISTQKLHARGPMALKELTSYKYEIYGAGQVRA